MDSVIPITNIINPVNNTDYYGTDIDFDMTCTDNHLYRANYTITDVNGSVVDSDGEINIIGNAKVFDVTHAYTNFSNAENHSVFLECADAHTTTKLKEIITPTKPSLNVIEFPLSKGTISVEVVHSGDLIRFDYVKDTDRYLFDVGFSKGVSSITYRIYAHDMVEVADTDYPCHLVLNDAYWWDGFHEGMESCELTHRPGYYEAVVTFPTKKLSTRSESLGELNVKNQTVYFHTQTPSTLTSLNWSSIGVVCGNKYPDNTFTLNFNDSNITNCVLKVNDYLYDDWESDCGSINITTNIGWQNIRLTALDDSKTSISSECNVWNDKIDKDFGDFMWFIILIGVILFLIAFSTKVPLMLIFAGFLTVFLGFMFYGFSWILGGSVIVIGVILILATWVMS
jgi:hypothetical protein